MDVHCIECGTIINAPLLMVVQAEIDRREDNMPVFGYICQACELKIAE